jgi:transposase
MSGGMLIPPGPVRVLVATKPVDFRKGVNGLAALVQEQLKGNPFSGTIYCFALRALKCLAAACQADTHSNCDDHVKQVHVHPPFLINAGQELCRKALS